MVHIGIKKLTAELRIMDRYIHDFDGRFLIREGDIIGLDLANVDLGTFPYFPRSILDFINLEYLSLQNIFQFLKKFLSLKN